MSSLATADPSSGSSKWPIPLVEVVDQELVVDAIFAPRRSAPSTDLILSPHATLLCVKNDGLVHAWCPATDGLCWPF